MACLGHLFNECTDICFSINLRSSVYSMFRILEYIADMLVSLLTLGVVTYMGHFLCPWSLSVPLQRNTSNRLSHWLICLPTLILPNVHMSAFQGNFHCE